MNGVVLPNLAGGLCKQSPYRLDIYTLKQYEGGGKNSTKSAITHVYCYNLKSKYGIYHCSKNGHIQSINNDILLMENRVM